MSSPEVVGIIGGSGVQLTGQEPWIVKTPFGPCLVSSLDADKKVLFASRHHCTSVDASSGKASYAPPHEVNYQALIWALVVESGCKGIIALGSTGSLDPEKIPVGSVVMADDYYMVRPEATTFWGHEKVGTFGLPDDGGVGHIHYTPANPSDENWTGFRRTVQEVLQPTYAAFTDRIRLADGQTAAIWPCRGSLAPGRDLDDSIVYVQSIGPRFETRAEIRAYRGVGHIVGMTCGREWALCEELKVPYCLVCFCDNACNGLSTHPGGAMQEYLDHKQTIVSVTSAVIERLVAHFSRSVKSRKE